MNCPSCGLTPSTLFRDARAIANELAARERFLSRGRDLTEVTLGTPADVFLCDRCGILIRDEAPDEDVFRDDRYNAAVLRALHEMHTEAFREKVDDYGRMLRAGARVVEIGSYAGGFLRAATDWGWRVAGVDIGRDTARFTASLGFEMSFELTAKSIDGLFVWNCFEQMGDPRALLAAAHDTLPECGLMVIRVPDADLYLHRRDLHLLAANGLLGWPHRFGYGVAALRRMAEEHGFELVRVLRRPALPPLPAEEPGWIELTFQRRWAAAA